MHAPKLEIVRHDELFSYDPWRFSLVKEEQNVMPEDCFIVLSCNTNARSHAMFRV